MTDRKLFAMLLYEGPQCPPAPFAIRPRTAKRSCSRIVTIADTSELTVTTNNALTRDTGTLTIKKTLSNPDGAVVPSSFTVNYDCGTGYTGSRSVSTSTPATVTGIPTGNSCTVTEVAPAAIGGFTWAAPTYSPSSIVINSTSGTSAPPR